MCKFLFISLCLLISKAPGQTLLLGEGQSPSELLIPAGYKLWAYQTAQIQKERPLREDLLQSAEFYLNEQMDEMHFLNNLSKFSDSGFTDQERSILIDTFTKKPQKKLNQENWLCRLDTERKCKRQTLEVKALPAILQKYEWLSVDGRLYPRLAWDNLEIPNENIRFTFFSSRYETYTLFGKLQDLKWARPNPQSWVRGNCDEYQVESSMQSLENSVFFNSSCLRSSIPPLKKKTFVENNKSLIWIAAGVVATGLAYKGLAGKNIVIEKPSFR